MLSLDISRESFQRAKNYSSLRQQQGRLPLDSELNEGADILADELRRAIKDIICSSGTPDDGFRISFASAAAIAAYDFSIDNGTYYVGGVRYDSLREHTFFDQPDWLQMEQDLPAPPARPTAGPTRHDFVYLDGWTQDVSATEDSELFERALAGADGAGRQRRMARRSRADGRLRQHRSRRKPVRAAGSDGLSRRRKRDLSSAAYRAQPLHLRAR